MLNKIFDDKNRLRLPFIFVIVFLSFIGYSVFVRAQGLGYSNFQGDEVNPMDFMYEMKDGLLPYLFDQKRGPIQYVVNIINVSFFGYHSEFLIRLPFLIFGIMALLTLYYLAKRIFNKTVAFFAVTLMAVNGLFIAFSRITQYQSFMYFVIPIGVLFFIKGIEKKKLSTLVISGLLISLALLAHYDTMSVFPFFIVGFAGMVYREFTLNAKKAKLSKIIKSYVKPALVFFSFALIPTLIYYIPFYLHSSFEEGTSGYLSNRLFGGGLMPRTEITAKLLAMYMPRFHMYLLFALGVLGIAFFYPKLNGYKINKLNIKAKWVKAVYIFSALLLLSATIFSFYPIKPRLSSLLVISCAIFISFILTFSKKLDWKKASLATWFLGAFSFYFFMMKDPRTHVYVSMIPLFILAGYGITKSYYLIPKRVLKYLFLTLFAITLFIVSVFNWVVFVDKSPEYPWWDKDYFGMRAYHIERVRHKKIEGVFGFNNYRAWEQVADLYNRGCLVGTYNSNEKDAITYFYLRLHQKKGDLWDVTEDTDNLFLVEAPHSWIDYDTTTPPEGYVLLKTISVNGMPVNFIYGKTDVYPDGKMLCGSVE